MRLHYHKLGSGQPLFILHGLFGMSDNWLTVGKKLAEHFSVYLIDLRNFGQSPHSDKWTYPAMANDIHELIEDVLKAEQANKRIANHLPSVILMGHSLGGKVAMQFASMYPENLEKLIVVDMTPKDFPENSFDFIPKLLAINLTEITSRKEAESEITRIVRDRAIVQLLLKNIRRKLHPHSLSKRERGNSQTLEWKLNMKTIAENINKIGKTFSIKNKIDTSALFIRGEKSNYILDSDILSIKEIFTRAEFKTVNDAGHWVHAENPEKFLECVEEFVK